MIAVTVGSACEHLRARFGASVLRKRAGERNAFGRGGQPVVLHRAQEPAVAPVAGRHVLGPGDVGDALVPERDDMIYREPAAHTVVHGDR